METTPRAAVVVLVEERNEWRKERKKERKDGIQSNEKEEKEAKINNTNTIGNHHSSLYSSIIVRYITMKLRMVTCKQGNWERLTVNAHFLLLYTERMQHQASNLPEECTHIAVDTRTSLFFLLR